MPARVPVLLIACLALLHATSAQTSYVVVPRGTETTEGHSRATSFGEFPSMRLQWADGEFSNTVQVIRGFGCRVDGTRYQLGQATAYVGRKHASLRIYCASTDHKTMNSTFSRNALSTPALVFSGASVMPAQPATRPVPSPWDARLSYPFRRSFIHFGNRDLLIDLQASGGTLDNKAPWAFPDRKVYNFDSVRVSTYDAIGRVAFFGNGPNYAANRTNFTGCRDSAGRRSYGPDSMVDLRHMLPTHPIPSSRNKVWATLFAHQLATYARALVVVGAAH